MIVNAVLPCFVTKKELYAYLPDYCGETMKRRYDRPRLDEIQDFFDRFIAASVMKTKQLQLQPNILPFINVLFWKLPEMSPTYSGKCCRMGNSLAANWR
jgi:hypothetical protein